MVALFSDHFDHSLIAVPGVFVVTLYCVLVVNLLLQPFLGLEPLNQQDAAAGSIDTGI